MQMNRQKCHHELTFYEAKFVCRLHKNDKNASEVRLTSDNFKASLYGQALQHNNHVTCLDIHGGILVGRDNINLQEPPYQHDDWKLLLKFIRESQSLKTIKIGRRVNAKIVEALIEALLANIFIEEIRLYAMAVQMSFISRLLTHNSNKALLIAPTSLEDISITDVAITQRNLIHSFSQNTSLQRIEFDTSSAYDYGRKETNDMNGTTVSILLKAFSAVTSLKELKLKALGCGFLTIDAITYLLTNAKFLKKLCLEAVPLDPTLGEESFHRFSKALASHSHLEDFRVTGCHEQLLDATWFAYIIEGIKQSQCLRLFDIDRCILNDNSTALFLDLLKCQQSKIETLYIGEYVEFSGRRSCSSIVGEILDQKRTTSNLKAIRLCVYYQDVSFHMNDILAPLRTDKTLESLAFEWLDNNQLEVFTSCLPSLQGLQRFSINETCLLKRWNKNGRETFLKALQENFSLQRCSIGGINEGVAHSEIKQFQRKVKLIGDRNVCIGNWLNKLYLVPLECSSNVLAAACQYETDAKNEIIFKLMKGVWANRENEVEVVHNSKRARLC